MAEADFDNGHIESAKSICDEIIADGNAEQMSVDRLCRLSVLLVKLADHGDEESYIALAARSMKTALARDADSVRIFVRNLPVDQQAQTVMLQQLTDAIDRPVKDLTDSIDTNHCHIDTL